MKTIQEIKKATIKWNEKRWNPKKVKRLLEKASFFTITREEYQNWKAAHKSIEFIHAYPAIYGKELKFVLIDSETDKIPLSEESIQNIFVKDYVDNYNVNDVDFLENSTDGNVTVTEALKRVMRWGIMRESWIDDQINTFNDDQMGIFRVFNIPFSDLDNAFTNPDISEIILNIGLKLNEDRSEQKTKYMADLLLWSVLKEVKLMKSMRDGGNDGISNDAPVDDLVGLCPPWNENEDGSFSLLK